MARSTLPLVAFLLLSCALAFAEDTSAQSVQSNYDAADAVFLGFVQGLDRVPEGLKVTFKIDTAIKGVAKQTQLVGFVEEHSQCGKLKEFGTYLVYARDLNHQVWVDLCHGTKHRSVAEGDLRYIHTINHKVDPECSGDRINKLISKATIIVEAEVIGPREEFWSCWSGIARCTEDVAYRLKRTLKGRVNQQEFLVEHVLVHNSLSADIDVPRVSPILFRPGNLVLLFLESGTTAPDDRLEPRATRGVSYVDIDEDCGALAADADELEGTALSKGNQ